MGIIQRVNILILRSILLEICSIYKLLNIWESISLKCILTLKMQDLWTQYNAIIILKLMMSVNLERASL